MSNHWFRPGTISMLALLPTLALAGDRFIVKFKDVNEGRAALAAHGVQRIKDLGPQQAAAVRIPAGRFEALKQHPAIEYIEEDLLREPYAQSVPYGITQVQADQVWPSADGAGRTVCIIDTGLAIQHEDIQDSNVTGYPADWNNDTCGHGTHVAGTIAGLSNNAGVVGVLPNGVKLHIVKVFGGADCAWTYASDLVDALNRCVSAGANVVNMSLGGSFSSQTEQSAFQQAYDAGVLSIAAAGNEGGTRKIYPASYPSVVSVAAIDANKVVASFSQKNDAVELSAPGVGVLSTVPWNDSNAVTVDAVTYAGGRIDGAARGTATGAFVNGGRCTAAGAWSGRVVLCERGDIAFADKVTNVVNGGGVAAVIYNNVPGGYTGTLGTGVTSSIPAIAASQEDGQFLAANKIAASATVVSAIEKPGSGYEAWDGTSMATPHVAGVAALVWSYNPAWTNAQIRDALVKTAEDLGTAGRDNSYGFGAVRARAALDYLIAGNGGGTGEFISGATGYKSRGKAFVDLTWSGSSAASVDVYRNGAKVITTANDGAYKDSLGRANGTFTYKVCEAATTVCSSEASVSF